MTNNIKLTLFKIDREGAKKHIIFDLQSKEFEEKYPLHYESIKILKGEINPIIGNEFISNSKDSDSDFAFAVPLVNRIEMSVKMLEKPLNVFAATYSHEATHITEGLNIALASTTILTKLGSLTKSLGYVAGIPATIYDKSFGAAVGGAIIGGSFMEFGCGLLAKKLSYKSEHRADLGSYNTTSVLPSVILKSLNRCINENLKNDTHPSVIQRDAYVLKNGNPKPDARLLELFEADKIARPYLYI